MWLNPVKFVRYNNLNHFWVHSSKNINFSDSVISLPSAFLVGIVHCKVGADELGDCGQMDGIHDPPHDFQSFLALLWNSSLASAMAGTG